jgi:hypothetical protein
LGDPADPVERLLRQAEALAQGHELVHANLGLPLGLNGGYGLHAALEGDFLALSCV